MRSASGRLQSPSLFLPITYPFRYLLRRLCQGSLLGRNGHKKEHGMLPVLSCTCYFLLSWQAICIVKGGNRIWATFLFLSVIMHRKVIPVNVFAVFFHICRTTVCWDPETMATKATWCNNFSLLDLLLLCFTVLVVFTFSLALHYFIFCLSKL